MTSPGEISPDGDLLAALGAVPGMGFLRFDWFINWLRLPEELRCQRLDEHRRCRHFYLGKFGKASWAPEQMWEKKPSLRLVPPTCFNIHIEEEYSVLHRKFPLALHYETNPWQSQEWLKRNLRRGDYQAYLNRRDRFIEALRTRPPNDLQVSRRQYALQIGKWKSNPSPGVTVRAARDQLSTALTELAAAVDNTLEP